MLLSSRESTEMSWCFSESCSPLRHSCSAQLCQDPEVPSVVAVCRLQVSPLAVPLPCQRQGWRCAVKGAGPWFWSTSRDGALRHPVFFPSKLCLWPAPTVPALCPVRFGGLWCRDHLLFIKCLALASCPTHVIQILTAVVDVLPSSSAPSHVGQPMWKYSFEISCEEQAALQSQVLGFWFFCFIF